MTGWQQEGLHESLNDWFRFPKSPAAYILFPIEFRSRYVENVAKWIPTLRENISKTQFLKLWSDFPRMLWNMRILPHSSKPLEMITCHCSFVLPLIVRISLGFSAERARGGVFSAPAPQSWTSGGSEMGKAEIKKNSTSFLSVLKILKSSQLRSRSGRLLKSSFFTLSVTETSHNSCETKLC